MASRAKQIEELKQRIATLESRPLLHSEESGTEGLLATPAGVVHEVFADTLVETGAALGFALAQARRHLQPCRPGLLILQLKADAQELGFPYAPGLRGFGLEAEAVVLIRTDTVAELLWAAEEAIACRAVGAVVADLAHTHKTLDFTASRRLALRTAAAQSTMFLVRYARGREASAARFRWRIAAQPSRPPPFDQQAPGRPRWEVTLEKGSLGRGRGRAEGKTFLVDWTDNGIVPANTGSRERPRHAGGTALSAAAPAALGHRLSETG